MSFRYYRRFLRSFGREDQTKLGCGALISCFLVSLLFLAFLKPSITTPFPISNLKVSMGAGLNIQTFEAITSSDEPVAERKSTEIKLTCNLTDPSANLCEMEGDIRIHGSSSTIFASSFQKGILQGNRSSFEIRPYTKKKDRVAMAKVNKLWVKSLNGDEEETPPPLCNLNHSNLPAVVFSLGGYTGNLFHDFNDVLVPLFLSTYHFHGQIQLLITNYKPWWINKYSAILKRLSDYPVVDLDRENRTLCFHRALVGLWHHKELSIDAARSPSGYSMQDFTKFLRSSYSLERDSAIRIGDGSKKKPRLFIISRKWSRMFKNQGEIVDAATHLGYEVVVAEANALTNMTKFARKVNACDVMMGVHGAGLTNQVFLPTNAVVIQVIPLGELGWCGRTFYGIPATDMKLRYLEYNIKENESSLIEQYPLEHAVFRDPISIQRKGWDAIKSVYLDKQNVKLDMGRFRSTLEKALELLHH